MNNEFNDCQLKMKYTKFKISLCLFLETDQSGVDNSDSHVLPLPKKTNLNKISKYLKGILKNQSNKCNIRYIMKKN